MIINISNKNVDFSKTAKQNIRLFEQDLQYIFYWVIIVC